MPLGSRLLREARSFALALSFLTRLGPAFVASDEEMRGSVAYYPLAGFCLGGCLVLFALAGNSASSLPFNPLIGVCTVALWAWLTRALHLDGFSDLLDALGSGKKGEGFHAVLKDSRIGAFGASGLCLLLLGKAAACTWLLGFTPASGNTFAALFFIPAFARCFPVFLALLAPPHPKASLGKIVQAAPKRKAAVAAGLCVLPLFFLPLFPGILFVAAGGGILLFFLRRTACRVGGYNGDFFGFAIESAEFLALCAVISFPAA